MNSRNVISVSGLTVIFNGKDPFIAINDISFQIDKGKTLAIVGESGSGKSLTALALMGLLPKNANLSGELMLTMPETDTVSLTTAAVSKVRGAGYQHGLPGANERAQSRYEYRQAA